MEENEKKEEETEESEVDKKPLKDLPQYNGDDFEENEMYDEIY